MMDGYTNNSKTLWRIWNCDILQVEAR
jgi:hypothetical protein